MVRDDPETETLSLLVDETLYRGWTGMRVTRGLDRMATDFHIEVTERWPGRNQPWQINIFSPCKIIIGKDVILTGYIDYYTPSFGANEHGVMIIGRSKTQDIIDCTPNIQSGQFRGYKLDAIARAIAGQFGIDVVVDVDVGEAFLDATIQRGETGFQFLERLCRLRSILATDDAQGRLVLTQAGASRGVGNLTQDVNILAARGRLSGARRFSEYRVKGQRDETAFPDTAIETDGEPSLPDTVVQQQVVTDFEGVAYDPGVPRYRPHTVMAESALDAVGAQKRADWEARYNAARGTEAHITVQGWRQPDGSLWQVNQLLPVHSDYLKLSRDLLVASVTYGLNLQMGRFTELLVGPVEGYTPDPGQVKVRKNKGAGQGVGGADPWNGLGSSLYINPNAIGPAGGAGEP